MFKNIAGLFLCGFFVLVVSKNNEVATLYEGIETCYNIPSVDNKKIVDGGGDATYGEITPEGVLQLIEILKPTSKDVFYDLGSGRGMMVLLMHSASPVRKATGVELAKHRHNIARTAYKKAQKNKLINKNRPVKLLNDDILTVPISDATIIYFASTCFSNEFIAKMVKRFVEELAPGARIASLRALEHPKLKEIGTYPTKMTWSDTTPVHIYKVAR